VRCPNFSLRFWLCVLFLGYATSEKTDPEAPREQRQNPPGLSQIAVLRLKKAVFYSALRSSLSYLQY
jgi:hypothetical protein